MFPCKHKFGKVDDGYQYCIKCGKAIPVPAKQCEHKFIETDKLDYQGPFQNVYKALYIIKCTKCGILRRYDTSNDDWNNENDS